MVGAVIVTHGKLAEEFLKTAEMVVGPQQQFKALSLSHTQSSEEIRKSLKNAIKDVNTGSGVLILTDMFGGTPCNLSLSFLGEQNLEVISGVNLPMLLKLALFRHNSDLATIKEMIVAYGRENIVVASEMLTQQADKPKQEEKNDVPQQK